VRGAADDRGHPHPAGEGPTGRPLPVAPSIEAAVEQAQELAGDKDVVVMGGGELCRRAIAAGLVDAVRLHLSPILLGAGTPLFEGGSPLPLRQVAVTSSSTATHLVYRIDR
jgi:dihydrofolate reductase